jgi:hypothetical protein
MHIPDLEILAGGWVAVGWLHPDYPFSKGEVPTDFVSRLRQFTSRWGDSVDALNWGVAAGIHTCEFCGKVHASGTFGVMTSRQVYYVPEMIGHYIEAHSYAPPAEFIAAVMACPIPGTLEYNRVADAFASRLT